MSYYDGDVRWKRIAAGVILAVAVIIIAFKFIQPGDVSIKWDSSRVNRGEMATLWVRVENGTAETMDMVIVNVEPISPYLRVYSEHNASSGEFKIPKLASGAEAIAKFGVFVDPNAYAGDHALRITIAMPGKTLVHESKIRVI